jgi:hypothetical protein
MWSISGGSLPPGLSLNPVNAILSGIPTAAGNYSFTIRVTADDGQFSEKLFALRVN